MPACTDFSEHIIHRNKTENKTGMKKKLLNIAIAASAVLFASGCSENATEDFTDRLHDLIDRTEEKINSQIAVVEHLCKTVDGVGFADVVQQNNNSCHSA